MGAYLDDFELYLWGEGTNYFAYRSLGCHRVRLAGREAFRFAVWAPEARSVSVVGEFNGWDTAAHPMEPCGNTGVWQAFVAAAQPGDTYKYAITARSGELLYKADPFAFFSQKRPNTASVVWELGEFNWQDAGHMQRRAGADAHSQPMNVYEVHLGSWKQGLGYAELSEQLVRYVADMGYTHIELMPVTEHPFDGSWGYQVTGYFAATSRYGTPEQLKQFVDCCHQAGISVILDWVPAHFPRDAHGLFRFDGSCLFEPDNPLRSEQPQWGTVMFDFGRNQVRSFLISSAVFWLNEFHIDGLRVDAVSSMLYLDYGREQWMPNPYGGRENLDAISFLRQLSTAVHRHCPGALLIAEESTAFPNITGNPEDGFSPGLGFDFKWNMGWMNDTLSYMDMDSLFRRYHHDKLTFPMCYAYSEHYVLPLSHDEVVHGKRSLINRMPGYYVDQFRQLRLLYMYQFAFPGKKLCFMGGEFGQFIEWNYKIPLDWFLLEYPAHAEMQEFVRELNRFYRATPALFEVDDSWDGFCWLVVEDARHSVAAFVRRDAHDRELVCAFNFTPVKHEPYRLRMPWEYRNKRFTQAISSVDMRSIAGLSCGEDGQGCYLDIVLSPYEAVYYYVLNQDDPEDTT